MNEQCYGRTASIIKQSSPARRAVRARQSRGDTLHRPVHKKAETVNNIPSPPEQSHLLVWSSVGLIPTEYVFCFYSCYIDLIYMAVQ